MRKLELTPDEERFYLSENALSRDASDNLILVGLSLEESIWLVETGRSYAAIGRRAFETKFMQDQYWLLYERHRNELMKIAYAIDEIKSSDPTIN